MKLRDWPEFDLIRPAGANRLIVGSKTVRTIGFGQFWFWPWPHRLMKPSENLDLRAATTGQAKSTGYFMKLRDWPEFDLIGPAGANRLIVGFKTVGTIEYYTDQ